MINRKTVIGITDCSKWENYAKWFLECPAVEVIRLSHKELNFSDMNKCHGIVLSGGEDVHPKYYGKTEYLSMLKPGEIKEERDEFELKLIENALRQKKPILGICRGLQIANVFFGGTLIPDIPASGKPSHSKVRGYDERHMVNIFDDSVLKNFIGKGRGEVNSAHHQSADVVADDLKVVGCADDGIIEALEWKKSEGKSMLLLVQWHPERMADSESPLAGNIREGFLHSLKELNN